MKTKYLTPSTVILINRNGMGKAEPELQQRLIRTYLTLLVENELYPNAICFYTEGVFLVAEGSKVIDLLQTLEEKEVRLIICNTCINYYGIADKVKVGIVGGMTDIIDAQLQADKVITL